MHRLFFNIQSPFFYRARARRYSSAAAFLLFTALSTAFGVETAKVSFQTAAKNVASADYGVSLSAVDQLGRSRDERAVVVLSKALTGEKRMAVRRAMVDALGLLRFDSGRPAILTALQDPEAQVRQSAVVALEAIGGASSDNALIAQAATEKNFAVKAHLIQILGRSKNPKAQQRLERFAEDSNSQLRDLAQKEIERKEKRKTQ
jgi:HEAT repeat protein